MFLSTSFSVVVVVPWLSGSSTFTDRGIELMRETPQARDVFMYISELEYNRALLRNFETLARVWLTRHALTPDQALQIMTAQGIDPTYAKALVDAYDSHRLTQSCGTLINWIICGTLTKKAGLYSLKNAN